MKKVRVKMSSRDARKLFDEVARNLDAADQRFRRTHEGYPFDVVRKDAPAALPIELSNEAWDAYSAAVASGNPFHFKLT